VTAQKLLEMARKALEDALAEAAADAGTGEE
jgi:hypothetical protein